MADLSGLLSAVQMGIDRKRDKKDRFSENINQFAQTINQRDKDILAQRNYETEMNEKARQHQVEQGGLNTRAAKLEQLTRDTEAMNALARLADDMTTRRGQNYGLLGRGNTAEDEDLYDFFVEMRDASISPHVSDWALVPGNLDKYGNVTADPAYKEKLMGSFKKLIVGKSESERNTLISWYEDYLRNNAPPVPDPEPEPVVSRPPRVDAIADALEKSGAKNAMDFWEKTGYKLESGAAQRYLDATDTEEPLKPQVVTPEISERVFGGDVLTMPQFTKTRRTVAEQQADWGNKVNEVKALLNDVFPIATPEERRNIFATAAPMMEDTATLDEIKALIGLLNQIGGQ